MAEAWELFSSPDLLFATLLCRPDDDDWEEDNVTTHPIVALPLSPVWQVHGGRPRTLMTPNSAVFHHEGGEYRRERFLDRSYRCLFFFPSESLVRQIVAEEDERAADAETVRFPTSTAPVEGRVFALARRVAGWLASGAGRDADGTDAAESLFDVLRPVVLAAFHRGATRGRARPSTARARRELVEGAKALIAARVAEQLTMDAIATALHVSPYHLARVFRSETGYSIHAYRTNLRLREGLLRLTDRSSRDISSIGTDLGFSSHSHFTAAFRRVFAATPSRVRSLLISGRRSR
jgi:AraC family transcriptional regulator